MQTIKAVEFVGWKTKSVYMAKVNGRVYEVPSDGTEWYGSRKIVVIERKLKQFNIWCMKNHGTEYNLIPEEIEHLPNNIVPESEVICHEK
jgi:hypothetical protein